MKPYFQNKLVTLYHADALELADELPKGTADMVLTDPPYGTLKTAWDVAINENVLVDFVKGIVKENGAVVMSSQNPYAAKIICAAGKFFRYEWVIKKTRPCGFANSNKMPMRVHELDLVFYKKPPTFNKQFTQGVPYIRTGTAHRKKDASGCYNVKSFRLHSSPSGKRFPVDLLEFKSIWHSIKHKTHPTEKSVDHFSYMIKTYTATGALVVDPFAGGGTTGVACMNLNRHCILVEKDEKFCEMSSKRLEAATVQPSTSNL